MLDGYGLTAPERAGVAVADAADQVRSVTDEGETGPLWAVVWRVDAVTWIQRHSSELEESIAG